MAAAACDHGVAHHCFRMVAKRWECILLAQAQRFAEELQRCEEALACAADQDEPHSEGGGFAELGADQDTPIGSNAHTSASQRTAGG